MSIENVLKEYKPNKALLENKRIRKEKVLDHVETLENLLSQETIEFTEYEIIETEALAKAVGEYTGITFDFRSKTEDIAIGLDNTKKEYNIDKVREVMREQLNKYRKELEDLEKDIHDLAYGVDQIDNGLKALKERQRYVIELRYFEGYEWNEIVDKYEEKYPDKPLQLDMLQKIKKEAITFLESVVYL